MPTAIAIAVVEHEGRFLVGQRLDGVPLAGLWEFPGGKISPGESPEDAAVRECLEETGLHVQSIDRYPAHIEQYDHGQVHLHFIACRPATAAPLEQIKPRAPFRWVLRADLAHYEFPAGNAQLVASLLTEI